MIIQDIDPNNINMETLKDLYNKINETMNQIGDDDEYDDVDIVDVVDVKKNIIHDSIIKLLGSLANNTDFLEGFFEFKDEELIESIQDKLFDIIDDLVIKKEKEEDMESDEEESDGEEEFEEEQDDEETDDKKTL